MEKYHKHNPKGFSVRNTSFNEHAVTSKSEADFIRDYKKDHQNSLLLPANMKDEEQTETLKKVYALAKIEVDKQNKETAPTEDKADTKKK